MSLVNDMLRDLECRDARGTEPLAGVRPAARLPARKPRANVVVPGLFVLLVAAAVFGFEYRTPVVAMPEGQAPMPGEFEATVTQPLTSGPAVAALASLPRYRLDYRLAQRPALRPPVAPAARVAPAAAIPAAGMSEPVGPAEHTDTESGVSTGPASGSRVVRTRIDSRARLRADGIAAMRRGLPAQAERFFRELVALTPSDTEAHVLLHRALVAQSRTDEAQAVLSDALEVSAEPARIASLLAHSLLNAGDSSAAQAVLEMHRGARGADLEYVALLAAVYERNGQYEQAAQGYVYLVSQRPGHGAWWIGLAIANDALGHHDKARAAFERARRSRGLDPALARYASERLTRMDTGP